MLNFDYGNINNELKSIILDSRARSEIAVIAAPTDRVVEYAHEDPHEFQPMSFLKHCEHPGARRGPTESLGHVVSRPGPIFHVCDDA